MKKKKRINLENNLFIALTYLTIGFNILIIHFMDAMAMCFLAGFCCIFIETNK